MSEVKRYINCVIGMTGVEMVRATDYAKLEAEAQALREEIKKAQNALAFTEQWYGVRHERLWHWAHAELNEEQKRRYFNIVANGTAEHSEPPTFAQQLCRMKHRAEVAEKEVAALRAKLAMAEDAAAKGDAARQQCGGMEMEIQELRENAAKLAAFAQEIISGALEGGSFDGADIQESAERHELIAKQVMNETCRGPEEYCACAWSTSFPTECYRITAELRALLNQDKENGNG
ncbi:hypothetical protein [Pseudomonas aeruginosa]|uniref:hypothetical protein n=1 Tax=Pseudomonas aeruginosa TaxID=287 RepID=UPI00300CE5EC